MRGKRGFDKLLVDENKCQIVNDAKRGRDKTLLQLRNTTLLHRYYFYVKIQRLTYSETLISLESEFFISQRTIIDVIIKGGQELAGITKQNLSVNQLIEKYNHLKWKNK